MLRGFALPERGEVERFRLAALLAFDEGLPDRLDLEAAFLFASDEVPDRLAVIGVLAGGDLRGEHVQAAVAAGVKTGPDGLPVAQTVTVYRTARRLMEGFVLVP